MRSSVSLSCSRPAASSAEPSCLRQSAVKYKRGYHVPLSAADFVSQVSAGTQHSGFVLQVSVTGNEIVRDTRWAFDSWYRLDRKWQSRLIRLLSDIESAQQSFFAGELVDAGKKALHAFECF